MLRFHVWLSASRENVQLLKTRIEHLSFVRQSLDRVGRCPGELFVSVQFLRRSERQYPLFVDLWMTTEASRHLRIEQRLARLFHRKAGSNSAQDFEPKP